MTQIIANRNKKGVVTINTGKETVTATIPPTRSMIGMIGVNGLIPNGEYREDGWVYLNNMPVRKWHSTVEGHRLWEPKLNNVIALYKVYKATQAANDKAWENIRVVIQKLWKGHKQGDKVIAHAFPAHHTDNEINNEKNDPDWWEYEVHDDGYGVSFGFHWTNGKPAKLQHPKEGQLLYELERRWWDNTCRRAYLAKTIFYAAMKRSLPKATGNKILSLQFGEDTFWFRTESKGPKIHWWEMFDDRYSFEIKKIL